MEYGAIDLHMRRSEIQIEDEQGQVTLARRIDTRRDEFERVFRDRPRMRMLLESATESEWVAQCLERIGHEVIVVDPNYLPMYGQRNRRVKTDKRDVAALTAACRTGTYRPASRVSAAQRGRRQELRVRRHLVQIRTRTISLIRALLRQEGLRLPRGTSETVSARLDRVTVSAALQTAVAPLREKRTPTRQVVIRRESFVARQGRRQSIASRRHAGRVGRAPLGAKPTGRLAAILDGGFSQGLNPPYKFVAGSTDK